MSNSDSAHLLRQRQLFLHLPERRVLLCKECRYAIQPSAISRHLKEIHRIYRSDRRVLVEYAQGLDLADPPDVVLPRPHEPPVPFLPIEGGLACGAEACGYLCVTAKRMKHHWKQGHDHSVSKAPTWRPVHLQTFFRGNQLRYFVVWSSHSSCPQGQKGADNETSSFASSTPEAPFTDYPDWSADDMGLLRHFLSFSYQDFGLGPEGRQVWQTIIPQLACEHSFLKHGILACSALHLAHQIPSERRHYQFTAAHHQNRALPSFRSTVACATEHNCHALFAFSQLLIIHCFATKEQDEDLLLVGGRHESGLPDWLQVIRGSCTIFGSVWQFMADGPLTPLLVDMMHVQHLPPIPEASERARRLELLTKLPLPGSRDIPPQADDPCSAALLILLEAFSRARAARMNSTFTVWTAVHIWPVQVPLGFLDLLRRRDPAALILLAHYCILLEPLEPHWFMCGFRKRLLSRIYEQLDPEWRHWLDWPMEEVGLWGVMSQEDGY